MDRKLRSRATLARRAPPPAAKVRRPSLQAAQVTAISGAKNAPFLFVGDAKGNFSVLLVNAVTAQLTVTQYSISPGDLVREPCTQHAEVLSDHLPNLDRAPRLRRGCAALLRSARSARSLWEKMADSCSVHATPDPHQPYDLPPAAVTPRLDRHGAGSNFSPSLAQALLAALPCWSTSQIARQSLRRWRPLAMRRLPASSGWAPAAARPSARALLTAVLRCGRWKQPQLRGRARRSISWSTVRC